MFLENIKKEKVASCTGSTIEEVYNVFIFSMLNDLSNKLMSFVHTILLKSKYLLKFCLSNNRLDILNRPIRKLFDTH